MNVAVLGLGQMGEAIAERLEAAGNSLHVWNRSKAATEPFAGRGATVLERPADALEQADVAITMLADDDAVRAVITGENGILTGSGAGVLIDMSTISAHASAEVAEAAAKAGVAYLRAPVSGNPVVVRAGNLGIIVSGPEETFEELRPLLGQIGPNLFHVGTGEQARILKLAINLMIIGTTQLLAEALVMSERHGLDRAKVLEVMGGSAIGSPYVKYKTQPLIDGDYSSTFTAKLGYKDIGLALDAAREVSVPMAMTTLSQRAFGECIAAGLGDLDISAVVLHLEQESKA